MVFTPLLSIFSHRGDTVWPRRCRGAAAALHLRAGGVDAGRSAVHARAQLQQRERLVPRRMRRQKLARAAVRRVARLQVKLLVQRDGRQCRRHPADEQHAQAAKHRTLLCSLLLAAQAATKRFCG